MLLTEEQARTKECASDRTMFCLASECMAWRWDFSIRELPGGDFWLRTNDETLEGVEVPRSEARGFCGLAGKVES